MTIEELENNYPENILFKGYRGSKSYGTFIEGVSDLDEIGIYIAPLNTLLSDKVIPLIKDEKGDRIYYEVGRFLELARESNPSIIEALNTPDDCIIFKHECLNELFDRKEEFLSKIMEKSFCTYAISQLRKAEGLGKHINKEKNKVKRADVLDFCYTPYKQGSINILEFLDSNGLKQEYCGLVKVPNMRYVYNIFYDVAQHIQFEKLSLVEAQKFVEKSIILKSKLIEVYLTEFGGNFRILSKDTYDKIIDGKFKNLKYKGIVQDVIKSNDISLSSVPKEESPICILQFNKDGYSVACKEYREHKEWEKNHNKTRIIDTKNANKNNKSGSMIDSKNMLHCVRILRMGREIALGQGVIMKRPDANYLLDIKRGKYELSEIQEECKDIIDSISNLYKNSNLPETVDSKFVDNLLISIRKKYYSLN